MIKHAIISPRGKSKIVINVQKCGLHCAIFEILKTKTNLLKKCEYLDCHPEINMLQTKIKYNKNVS